MARVRHKRKPVAEMNVVPYIDVMLVLLVIFMVTAPMLNQGVKVDLPKVSSEALPQDNNKQVLTLSVKADGSYYWNVGSEVDTEKQTDSAVSLEQMTDAVTKIMSARPDTQVFIRGDKAVNYGAVVGAMGALQQAGVPNVGLITEAPDLEATVRALAFRELFLARRPGGGPARSDLRHAVRQLGVCSGASSSKPIVQATLYQLKSKSQATTQTNQKIAGEAKKTASKQYEVEQLEQKKLEQQKLEQQKLEQQQVAAAKAAEQKKADEARKAEAQKAAEAKKADEAKKAAEAKAAEQKRQADIAKKRAEDEAKKKAADDAKKKAAEDAKKKAAEEAKKKAAAEAAKKKAAVEAAKKKAAAAAAAARKAAEDKKAQALAELLSDTTERQQALADEVGSEVTGSLDDLIVNLVSQQWRRPPSARNGMSVEVLIEMLPDGTITNASVSRSSGDKPFDSSAVAAVRNVGRIPEMQQLPRATFDSLYRQRRIIFKPEDLSL